MIIGRYIRVRLLLVLLPMVANLPKSRFVTTCGLIVTLSFDLLISISNQFIFVRKCTKIVNLVK